MNIGPEFRITPIYKLNESSNKALFTEEDAQNSGFALNLGLDYYIIENLSIGLKYSLRYDIITSQNIIQENQGSGVSKVNKGLLLGYHFVANYNLKVLKKGDLLLGIGFSLLNRNSEVRITEPIFDNGVQVGTASSLIDYKYSTNRIFTGYMKKNQKYYLASI